MDIRERMIKENQNALEQDMAAFGFVVTGLEDENIGEVVDEYGTRWNQLLETIHPIGKVKLGIPLSKRKK